MSFPSCKCAQYADGTTIPVKLHGPFSKGFVSALFASTENKSVRELVTSNAVVGCELCVRHEVLAHALSSGNGALYDPCFFPCRPVALRAVPSAHARSARPALPPWLLARLSAHMFSGFGFLETRRAAPAFCLPHRGPARGSECACPSAETDLPPGAACVPVCNVSFRRHVSGNSSNTSRFRAYRKSTKL